MTWRVQQTFAQQGEKSQGKGAYEGVLDRIAGKHASMRLDSASILEHVVAEYRALRASVLWLWSETIPTKQERDLAEVIRFDETIDQAIAEVTQRFADRATRYSDYFLGVLAHDVRNPLHPVALSFAPKSGHIDPQLDTMWRGLRRSSLRGPGWRRRRRIVPTEFR